MPNIRGTRKLWDAACLSQTLPGAANLRVICLQNGKAQFISIKDMVRPGSDIRKPKLHQTQEYYVGVTVSCLYYGDQRRISCIWWQALLIWPELLQQLTGPLQSLSLKLKSWESLQKINVVTSPIFFEGLIRIQAIFNVSLN